MTKFPIDTNPLAIGEKMPAFSLTSTDKKVYNINDCYDKNGLVLAFIHGTWCPYCVRLITGLNRIAQKLITRHVGIACISADEIEALHTYKISINPPLAYRLFADSTPSISRQFGIYDTEHESPYPAIFYANKAQIIQFVDVSHDPHCYPNLEQLVDFIKAATKP